MLTLAVYLKDPIGDKLNRALAQGADSLADADSMSGRITRGKQGDEARAP